MRASRLERRCRSWMEVELPKFLFLLSCVAVSSPALAQIERRVEDPKIACPDPDDGEKFCLFGFGLKGEVITVAASGRSQALSQTGKAVTVITREEIESVQGADITRILERAPGVTITRNGGIGATTSLRIRGSDNDQVLTMIDGVRVADPASIGNGYDVTNLLPGNIERIEVLRGSNSTIWGSSAVGGVILIDTAEGGTGARASVEYGSRDTLYVNGNASYAEDRFGITAYGSRVETEGFSALASGTEKDGFEQWAGGVNAYVKFGNSLTFRASGRYSDGTVEIDNFGDTEDTQDTTQYSGSASLDYDDYGLDVIATYSFADTERLSTSSFGPFIADGHLDRADLRAVIELLKPLDLYAGGYYEWTDYSTNFGGDAGLERRGGYVQLGWSHRALNLNVGLRIDDGTLFGSEVSLGADASYRIGRNARLHASYGEGYRAPSLFQLYDGFSGNPDLQPEDSRNYDLGLEVGQRGGTWLFDVTLFQRDIDNQIEFDPATFVYFNTESVQARGVEMEATLRPADGLEILAAYTILDTQLRSGPNAGNEQGRRPGEALTLSADWQTPFGGLTLGGDLRVVSDSFDTNANAFRLGSYEVVTVRASLPLSDTIELFGRVENVLDADYQTARGFNTAGRGVFGGVRATL